jgi:hypothetical protein
MDVMRGCNCPLNAWLQLPSQCVAAIARGSTLRDSEFGLFTVTFRVQWDVGDDTAFHAVLRSLTLALALSLSLSLSLSLCL